MLIQNKSYLLVIKTTGRGLMAEVEKEKQVAKLMIKIFCKKKHKQIELCKGCKELLNYVQIRAEKCPYKETKTFCSNCKTHCYKPDMREYIRTVMRFSGPRMILYHPVIAIKHLIATKKEGRE